MRNFYLTFAGFILLLSSCKKEQEIPAYVYIPKIEATGIYSISGSDSSKIYGARVFFDNQLVGVYQTPAEVPVFGTGEHSIKVSALVEKNGFFDDLIPYPYFELSETIVNLEAAQTVSIFPIVSYVPSDNVSYWFEDFENPGMSFITDPTSNADLIKTTQEELIYEGFGSGKFDLDAPDAYIKSISDENFFYKVGSNTFVEIDYLNNQPFYFDVVLIKVDGNTETVRFFRFNPSENEDGTPVWNKIYLEIGALLNSETQLASFEICFEVERDESVLNPTVLIDNVKLIRDK